MYFIASSFSERSRLRRTGEEKKDSRDTAQMGDAAARLRQSGGSGWLLLVVRRSEGADPVEHQRFRLAPARLVAAHGRAEVAPVEPAERERRTCADGGRARPLLQHRDLAEPVSRPQLPDRAAVADHLGLAVFDHVEAVA